jgi:hypothetical protein
MFLLYLATTILHYLRCLNAIFLAFLSGLALLRAPLLLLLLLRLLILLLLLLLLLVSYLGGMGKKGYKLLSTPSYLLLLLFFFGILSRFLFPVLTSTNTTPALSTPAAKAKSNKQEHAKVIRGRGETHSIKSGRH